MATKGTLLSPSERNTAIIRKRKKVIQWLCTHRWSTAKVLANVLGLGLRGTENTLAKMGRDGLIRAIRLETNFGRPIRLWGLTNHGLQLAPEFDADNRNAQTIQPSKISLNTLQHELDSQYIHAASITHGWNGWKSDTSFARELILDGLKVPDAIANTPNGETVALEVERTLKSQKRYEEIMRSHLLGIKNKRWDKVLYLSPTAQISRSVERSFQKITQISHKGQRVTLTGQHRLLFSFSTYEEFIAKVGF